MSDAANHLMNSRMQERDISTSQRQNITSSIHSAQAYSQVANQPGNGTWRTLWKPLREIDFKIIHFIIQVSY
jgi:hypothetical protein